MNEVQTTSGEAVESQVESKGALWRLQGVFFEPSATFEDISRKPGFWVALILCIVLSLVTTAVLFSKIDMGDLMAQQIRQSSQGQQMSEEQIQAQVDQIQSSPVMPVLRWLGPLFGTPIVIFAIAGILMLSVYLSGTETTFKKLLGVVTHSFFAYSVVSSALFLVVLLMAADPQAISIDNPVATNLGALLSAKENPILARLGASIDILSFYAIFLMGLGLSKICPKTSLSRGIVMIAIPWALYVAVAVAWKAFIG